MPKRVKVTQKQLDELVDDDGSLISSAVPDNAYLQSTVQNSTTDDHVKQARQQMIWMQYRRYYGEGVTKSDDKLTLMADKYANSPEKFYRYLQRIGEQHQFSKYFTKINKDGLINESNDNTFNDYPEKAKKNAKKALDWKEKHGDDVKGGTRVGWTRANQIANGENLSLDTVKRIKQFFDRHEGNEKIDSENKNEPWKDNGYVAWLIWGGDAMRNWANKIVEKHDNTKNESYKYGDLISIIEENNIKRKKFKDLKENG